MCYDLEREFGIYSISCAALETSLIPLCYIKMYCGGGVGGNLSDRDAGGVGFFLKEPNCEEGTRLFLTVERILAQEKGR